MDGVKTSVPVPHLHRENEMMELHNNTFESELSKEEFAGVVDCFGGHSYEEYTAEKTIFKEILATIESLILSIEEENTCLEKNEANFSDLKRTTWNSIVLQCPTDRDKAFEPKNDIVNRSPSQDFNENRVGNSEVLKTISGKTCVQQDSSSMKDLCDEEQFEYDPFECMKWKSVELDIQDINRFETVAEVHETPELSNATNVALLNTQEMEPSSFHTNLSLTDVHNYVHADDVHNSFCKFATNCELEMEVSTIKPCQVVLKRCDSLVEEYLINCPASYPSSLQADRISEVSNKNRGHKGVSNNLKSKRGKKKKLKESLVGDDSSHVVEPFPETRTNDGIKTNVTQEVCPGNDTLHLNVCNTEMNFQGEDIGETGKPTRRKRNASSVVSDDNSISIRTCKNWDCNDSIITENPQTLQSESSKRLRKDHNLFENADSEVDSDYSSSKENFKASECKNAKNVTNISSIHHELTPEGIEKSAIDLENNYIGDNIDLSELSDSGLFGSISNQQAMQFDFSSLKPCRVVLTRMELNSDETSSSHNATSLPNNYSVSFDLSDSSDLEIEEIFKPQQEVKESNWLSYNVDLSSRECFFDKEVKEVMKTPNLVSFSSVECDDSKYQFVETTKGRSARKRMSGFSESRSTELANVPPDESNAVQIPLPTDQSSELPKKSKKSKKCKKSQRGKESAPSKSPDSPGLIKSGIHRELLELYKNEFTQELKELKNIMKRTERKLDALLKLHEQVIDFYE